MNADAACQVELKKGMQTRRGVDGGASAAWTGRARDSRLRVGGGRASGAHGAHVLHDCDVGRVKARQRLVELIRVLCVESSVGRHTKIQRGCRKVGVEHAERT